MINTHSVEYSWSSDTTSPVCEQPLRAHGQTAGRYPLSAHSSLVAQPLLLSAPAPLASLLCGASFRSAGSRPNPERLISSLLAQARPLPRLPGLLGRRTKLAPCRPSSFASHGALLGRVPSISPRGSTFFPVSSMHSVFFLSFYPLFGHRSGIFNPPQDTTGPYFGTPC
jgi:hypothetical protein